MSPPVAIVLPTRGRQQSLDRALESIAPQAGALGADVVVVEDGGEAARGVAMRHNARWIGLADPHGPTAPRNIGIEAAKSDLIVLTEHDIEAPDGWLEAITPVGPHPTEIADF